jgi:hypothetical protein
MTPLTPDERASVNEFFMSEVRTTEGKDKMTIAELMRKERIGYLEAKRRVETCSTCGADGVGLTNGFCTGCWTARLESAVNIGMLELMAVESTPASRGDASARMAKLIMSNTKGEGRHEPK